MSAWAAYLTPLQSGAGPMMIYTMRRYGVSVPVAMTSTLMTFIATVAFFAIAGPLAILLGAGQSLGTRGNVLGLSLYDLFLGSLGIFAGLGVLMVVVIVFPRLARGPDSSRRPVGRPAQPPHRARASRSSSPASTRRTRAWSRFNTPRGWLSLFWAILLSGPSHANKLLAGYVALRALGVHAQLRGCAAAPDPGHVPALLCPDARRAAASRELLSPLVMSVYVQRGLTPLYILIWRTHPQLLHPGVRLPRVFRLGPPGDQGRSGPGRAGRRSRACPHEPESRMTTPEEALGRSYDPELMRRMLAYLRTLSRASWRWPWRSCYRQRAPGAGRPDPDQAGAGRGGAASRHRPARHPRCRLPGGASARIRHRVRAGAADHLHRPGRDARLAARALRTPATTQHSVFRPASRRAPDDPGHLRRRDAERALLQRGGRRSSAISFTLLAIMALMLGPIGASRWWPSRSFRWCGSPPISSAGRCARPSGDIRVRLARLNSFLQEHLSRHAGGAALRPGSGRGARSFADINRSHLAAHLRSITIYAVFFPVIEVLASVAVALILWYGGRPVRQPHADRRHSRRVHPAHPAVLPAAAGSVREVQHPAERDGLLGADLRPARRAGHGAGAGARRPPFLVRSGARCASRASGSATVRTAPWVLARCVVHRLARADAGAGRADGGGEDHDRSASCSGSTTRSEGGSRSTASISATCPRRSSGAASGSCSRTCSCSPATSSATCASTLRCRRRPPTRPRSGSGRTVSSSGCPRGTATCWASGASR